MHHYRGTAVIIGVASGNSLTCARCLANEGYDLILISADRERLHTVARRITDASGRSVEVLAGDLTAPHDLQRIEQALRRDASITLWVNCSISAQAWVSTLLANRTGAVIDVTRGAGCTMKATQWRQLLMPSAPDGSMH